VPRQPQAEKPDPQTSAPEEQTAKRPSQTTRSSKEGMVVEGRVPVLELYVPQPIKADDLAELNVYQRWNAMIGEMGIIPKRGWNDHHKYWFTTDADLNAFIGPLLSKYHLLVIPRILHDQVQRFETAGKQYVTRVPMEISVINADKPGDVFTVPWAGEGGDTVDKGLYKSYTGGLKYFFMKTLQVATGDDPEVFTKTDQLGEMAARDTTPAAAARPVNIRQSNAPQPEKGGHQTNVTAVQIRTIKAFSHALEYGPRGTAEMFDRVLGTKIFDTIDGMDADDEAGRVLTEWMKTLTGDQVGRVAQAMADEVARVKAEKDAPQPAPEESEEQLLADLDPDLSAIEAADGGYPS